MLFALSYLSFLRGDIIIEQYEMCKWRYLNSISYEKGRRVRRPSRVGVEVDPHSPPAVGSEESQETKEPTLGQNVIERDQEKLQEFLQEYSNPFLLKYIKIYWKDYDSVESHVELERTFDHLTERELNQLALREPM